MHGTGWEFYKYLPDNLALYVGDRRFIVHLTKNEYVCGNYIFIDRSDRVWENTVYGHLKLIGRKRYWCNLWNMIGSFCKRHGLPWVPHSGLQRIFVAEGKYRDASLYTLFKTLSTADLKTVGTVDAVAAVAVADVPDLVPARVLVPAPAVAVAVAPVVASAVAPAPDPLARLAAKEAKLQEETRMLDQMKAQVERLRAYPADLEAQMAAAKAELASLLAIEARVQELRALEATLIEKRKILQAPELI